MFFFANEVPLLALKGFYNIDYCKCPLIHLHESYVYQIFQTENKQVYILEYLC